MTMPMTVDARNAGYVVQSFDVRYWQYMGCSLNGLLYLWSYQEDADSKKIVCTAPLWDAIKGELLDNPDYDIMEPFNFYEVSSDEMVDDDVIAHGIDWIMTRRWIFKRLQNAPYIRACKYFKDATGIDELYTLYSLQMQRDVSKFLTSAGHYAGGGVNPFTGLETLGAVKNDAPRMNLRGRMKDDFPTSVVPLDDWVIVEDFLVRIPENYADYENTHFGDPTNFYANTNTNYHCTYTNALPLIPLEFNWNGADRLPTVGTLGPERSIQVISAGGKLYARGILRMGEAVIIPAAFDERGDPGEFFLLIKETHGYRSAYDPLVSPAMSADTDWLNMSPMLLNGELYGYLTRPADPKNSGICRIPAGGGVALKDGSAYLPRPTDENDIYYDPSTKAALSLGRQGMTFFTTQDDAVEGVKLVEDGVYDCSTLPRWVAPAGVIDSFTKRHIVGTFDNGAVATDIDNYFDRSYLRRRILPVSWGSFEQTDNLGNVVARSRISVGAETANHKYDNGVEATFTDVRVKPLYVADDFATPLFENIPFASVYRNPFNLRVLRHDRSFAATEYVAYLWTLKDAGLGNDIFAETNPYIPYYPMVYKVPDTNDRSTISWAWVNPETGELTDASFSAGVDWEIVLFPVMDNNGQMCARCKNRTTGAIENKVVNVPLPAWLENGNWARVGNPIQDSPNRVTGLKVIPVALPYPSMGKIGHYDNTNPVANYEESFLMLNGYAGLVRIVESSSNTQLFWRSSHFGFRVNFKDGGGIWRYLSRDLMRVMDRPDSRESSMQCFRRLRDFSEHGAGYYGSSPVTDCLGRTKYLHNLMIWGINPTSLIPLARGESLGTWEDRIGYEGDSASGHLYIIRADLDPEQIDFDAEMLKCKKTQP